MKGDRRMFSEIDMKYIANHLNHVTLLCKSGESEAYFANELAIKYYGDENGVVNVQKLFHRSTTHSFLAHSLKEEMLKNGCYATTDVGMIRNSGEEIISNLQVTFTSDKRTEFLLLLVPENDKRLEIAKSQVDSSHRGEAILEFDENLTIFHCNSEFYAMLGVTNATSLDLINHELSNTFRRDKRLSQVKEIRRGLQRNKVYHTEVEIINLTGDKCWYSLDLQRRLLDDGEEKLMCSMVNIDENVKANTKLSSLSQYFDSMQSLSGESMYVIDVNTRVLKQKGKVAEELGIPPEVYNYPESAYNLMHPNDLDDFKMFANNSLNGEQSNCKVRVLTAEGDYRWYELYSMVIRDDKGDVKEILGKMNNIDKEHQMETENTLFLQQFAAMQELTENILYQIDVKQGVLHYNVDIPKLENYGKSLFDYVNTFIHTKIVHPEDVTKYVTFLEEWYAGTSAEDYCSIRAAITTEEYQLYSIRGKKIFDKNGNLTHVLGALVNVQKEHDLEVEYTLLNQYFNVMQELSDDILYRVDVKTGTLYHNMESVHFSKFGKEIPDYINFMVGNKIIHPDDVEGYLKAQEEWLRGERDGVTVRATILTEEYEWYTYTGKKIFDEEGNLTEIFGTVRNVQKQKDLERRATHDLMTDVLNKVSFENEVIDVLKLSTQGQKHALVFVDLDDFKGVNDTLGHTFGDSLLISVGMRLKRALRDHDLVGRLGGDEFAVLIKSIDDEAVALSKANVLLEALQREFSFEGKEREIKASLGVALYPAHGDNYKDLIEKADLALYSSKRKGKNVATVYSEKLEEY